MSLTLTRDGAKIWVIVYMGKDGEELVGIEPNEEMLKAIRSVYPRKVIDY